MRNWAGSFFMNMPLYKMYWKRVGHVKRSRLPESVQCDTHYTAREELKTQAIKDGYRYLIFCKPRLISHSYFKVFCDILYRRDEPFEYYNGNIEHWKFVWLTFKYPNLKPEMAENKPLYEQELLKESAINIDDYYGIPRAHFNNISAIIGAVFDYGSEYFTIR
jgi:hypothetical protein